MSFEPLPQDLEQGVNQYARQQRVTHDEAVLMLIESGLRSVPGSAMTEQGKTPAEELIGAFCSPEDRSLMDEVVALAYEGRKAGARREPAT